MSAEKMCPCGCSLTWDQARAVVMANPNTAYSEEQAEAMLEQKAQYEAAKKEAPRDAR